MGSVLQNQGDYDGALEHHQKCLVIFESVLGKNPPHTATSYCNIGFLLSEKGNYDGAI
jgi:Tetratricopeptide repeat